MKLRIRFASQVVGVFLLLGVISILAIIVAMGSSQRWFSRDVTYTSSFPSAAGITVGMGVDYRGFSIGRVQALDLDELDRVTVTFTIQEEFVDRVTEFSVLELATSPIPGLGGGLVFHPGVERTEPLPEGSLIPSLGSPEGQRRAREGLADVPTTGDEITGLVTQLDPLIAGVRRVLTSLDEVLITVEQGLSGSPTGPVGAILTDLAAISADLTVITADVRTATASVLPAVDASLGTLETTLASVERLAANLEQTSAVLSDPEGLVPLLLGDEGSVGQLFADQGALYDQIDSILASVERAGASLEEFAAFINSTQPEVRSLLEQTRSTLDTGQDVLTGLSNNPLIRGGIPDDPETPTSFEGVREEGF